MSTATATIGDLRTDFRSVQRKAEEHGLVIITDNGVPSFELKPISPKRRAKKAALPDYYARLLKRQPKPMSEQAARGFWEYERGDR